MSHADALYQQELLQRLRALSFRGEPATYARSEEGFNPTCGDRIRLFLDDADTLYWEGRACSIAVVSADLMVECVRTEEQGLAAAVELREQLDALLQGEVEVPVLEKSPLRCLQSVRAYPMRHRCAQLPWNVLRTLMNSGKE